jgi:hypothetical protein
LVANVHSRELREAEMHAWRADVARWAGSVALILATTVKPFIAPAAAIVVALISGAWETAAQEPTAATTPTPTPTAWSPTPSPTLCCTEEWAWLSRKLPPSAVAGAPFTVSYEWRGGSAIIITIQEAIPAGWQVLSPPWSERTGDTYIWYIWNVSIDYGDLYYWHLEILPPAGLPSGKYRLYGSTTSWHSCCGHTTTWNAPIEGDQNIRISAAGAACVGDCATDGRVTVGDLIKAVNIALGQAKLDTCSASDRNGDGMVTVDELLTAVRMALEGCPP